MLFAGNPFANKPLAQAGAVLWQYWFTDPATTRATGHWWRRKLIGHDAPVLEHEPDGRFGAVRMPGAMILQR